MIKETIYLVYRSDVFTKGTREWQALAFQSEVSAEEEARRLAELHPKQTYDVIPLYYYDK